MRRSARCLSLCSLLLLGCVADAFGQTFTGGLRGAVRDANGVLPGVTVTLTNEATNVSREVVSNDVGQYNFPAVPPGTYSVKTQLTGYSNYESKGIIIGTLATLAILLYFNPGVTTPPMRLVYAFFLNAIVYGIAAGAWWALVSGTRKNGRRYGTFMR